jgi:hypothetical protein
MFLPVYSLAHIVGVRSPLSPVGWRVPYYATGGSVGVCVRVLDGGQAYRRV